MTKVWLLELRLKAGLYRFETLLLLLLLYLLISEMVFLIEVEKV